MEPFRNGTAIEQQWSPGLSIDSGLLVASGLIRSTNSTIQTKLIAI
jgi:hypothetical protein